MATTTRRRNAEQTRERILAAAVREFARAGFTAATVKSIADAAEVSPNLITRYFGGKDGLFVAAAKVRLGVEQMFDGPRESLGERMAQAIIRRWSEQDGHDPLLALLRSAGERQAAASMLAKFLDRESLQPLQRQLERYGMTPADAAARARAVDVFLLGVTARLRMLRDDLGDPAEAQAWMGESLQRLIGGA